VQDAIAVLDALGLGQVAVLAPRDSSLEGLLLAATYPERVSRLVIINGFARLRRADDYPWGIPGAAIDRFLETNIDPTSVMVGRGFDLLGLIAPSACDDPGFRSWWERSGVKARARRLRGRS